MSAKLKLTLACGDYEIMRPLKERTVKPDGIELTVLSDAGSRDRTYKIKRNAEVDVCEFNVCGYFIAREQGYPLTALPVFPHRRFRHGFIFINTNKGIEKASDLIGRKVGMNYLQPAAGFWIRGILQDDYGVGQNDVQWVTASPEDLPFTPPPGMRLEHVGREKSLDDMLVDGDIDALIAPSFPEPMLRGDKRVARLFPDYKAREEDYYRRTGIFPIMHAVTVRQDILAEHPWIAPNIVRAFHEAKQMAYRRVENPRVVPLAWFTEAWEEQQAILGPDPWAYGLTEANRKNLETAYRYTLEQGHIKEQKSLDELFVHVDRQTIAGVRGH